MRRILLDANVLLLYLVGTNYPEYLGWKRISEFDVDDVFRVRAEARGHRHVGLPNTLTEASNLLGAGKDEAFPGAALLLAGYCQQLDEIYLSSREVSLDPVYGRLGLTDTAVYRLADPATKVVTIDHELAGRLKSKGINVINLRHYKTPRTH